MADANARKAAIRTAVSQVRSGNTFTRRATAGVAMRKGSGGRSVRSKKAA